MSDLTEQRGPTLDELLRTVLDVVIRSLDDGRAEIDANTSLFSSSGRFDSFAMLQLVLALEDRFALSIRDEDLNRETFSSPLAIAQYVHDRLRSVS